MAFTVTEEKYIGLAIKELDGYMKTNGVYGEDLTRIFRKVMPKFDKLEGDVKSRMCNCLRNYIYNKQNKKEED